MSVLVLDAARMLPPTADRSLPSVRVKAAARRVAALALISLILCTIPSDSGPARTRAAAAPPLLSMLRDADR